MRFFYLSYMGWLTSWVMAQRLIARKRGVHRTKSRKTRTPQKLDHFKELMISHLLIATSITFIFVAAPWSIVREAFVPVQVSVGSVIALMGLGLTLLSQWYLGPNWTGASNLQTVFVQHKVVQTGPYNFVRHPMYTGLIVTAVGLSIGSWNIFFALGCLTFAGAFMLRAGPEEKALRALPGQRGRDYAAYAQTTGAFFPKVWHRNS